MPKSYKSQAKPKSATHTPVATESPTAHHHFYLGLILTAAIALVAFILYQLRVFTPAQFTNADFGIPPYVSSHDEDGDGFDDQSDILASALLYLETKPKYQSIYYSTGYPDDDHGVCTDVVAFAFLGAGYDLMELVNADILAHPDDYEIDTVDKNIDFRRVKNLYAYFKHTATSLTTNPEDIEAWQGGDIVVYPTHIGIVSDHRNSRGIPFILHHYSPLQIHYEEDVLASYDTIIGHFRITPPASQ